MKIGDMILNFVYIVFGLILLGIPFDDFKLNFYSGFFGIAFLIMGVLGVWKNFRNYLENWTKELYEKCSFSNNLLGRQVEFKLSEGDDLVGYDGEIVGVCPAADKTSAVTLLVEYEAFSKDGTIKIASLSITDVILHGKSF